MKEKIKSFFAVTMLLIGLSLLLYPTVSNYIHTENHRYAIFNYLESVEMLSDEEYEQTLADAVAYNENLSQRRLFFQLYDEELRETYYSLLNNTGTGLMGYIDIEKANIHLPIYHGTTEQVLQVGVGHLEGSSLPIGGEKSHCLLSGHRGLPSALLFTNLDKLQIGDTFKLVVLNESHTYQVDDIRVVLPDEVDFLQFEEGHDYCTLITCTPYGVNTHRLLVRGERMEISEEEEKMSIQSGARMINILLVIGIVEIPVLMISVSISASIEGKRSRRKKGYTGGGR